MSEITVPHNFEPRDYQLPLLQAMDTGITRACVVWHRRAGKDKTLINLIAKKMWERKGTYFYFMPTYAQGKKIIWNGMDRDGFKFLDHIPEAVRKRTDNQEMLIELTNGSIFQVIGTENIDTIVGTNPIGCVFSEYSLQDPQAWDFIRPILAENGGWAVFNFTPRGHNHGYDLFKMAESSEDWFAQKLTVDKTNVISKEILRKEREEIVKKDGTDALYLQEYYCSFEAPVQGAYYAHQILQADNDNRITTVPYEPSIPVNTFWDLGVGDSTAIWFHQRVGKENRMIDYYETSGEGLNHYARVLQDKGYFYGDHWAPHDIEVTELGTGKSRLETANELGISFRVAPRLSLDDGIDAARNIFPSVWFDSKKCSRGVDALKSYHKEYDEKNKVYKSRPKHDWSSHGADAFRYFAVSTQQIEAEVPQYDSSKWAIG